MVTIELTDKEAIVFRMLREGGAFEIRGGQAVISFDSEGRPKHVDITTRTLYTSPKKTY